MKKLAVLFGGKTVEHDVSIITGSQIMENADKNKYEIIPIYISRQGQWFTGEKLRDTKYFQNFSPNDKELTKVFLPPEPGAKLMAFGKGGLFGGGIKELTAIDVAIPAMHGMNGEDGTLQGIFELAEIPYTNPGTLGSSVGMDKIVMKAAFRGNGFPVLDACFFTREEWQASRQDILNRIEAQLPYPMFVKPANLGSSIGISKAKDQQGLIDAIEIAICYDKRIIVEKGVENLKEINCSGLGVKGEVKASLCEQPVQWEEFLSFEDKYTRGGKNSKGMQSLTRLLPAPISEEMTNRIQQMTVDVFRALDCKGVVRIDYIIDQDTEELFVNEINTIPGSFAFYLWEPLGISFRQLIDCIIEDAEYAMQQKKKNSYAFESDILKKVSLGGKTAK